MHIAIIIGRSIASKWGGDYQALRLLVEAVSNTSRSHTIGIYETPSHLQSADIAYIAGAKLFFKSFARQLKARGIRVGWFPFIEDHILFDNSMLGTLDFFSNAFMKGPRAFKESIYMLQNKPHIIKMGLMCTCSRLENFDYYSANLAESIIVSSEVEKETLRDFFPKIQSSVLHWQINAHEERKSVGDEFLELTGLKSKEYLLQVGRLEPRKNQLSTIGATMDLDIPLVFISTQGGIKIYENLCLRTAQQLRKAPTYFVGGSFDTNNCKQVHSVKVESGILPYNLILSAFKHCKLHVCPSFYELPGLVYFEAMQQGVHSVIGKWGAWKEYLSHGNFSSIEGKKYFTPVLPYDQTEIKEAILNALNIKVPDSRHVPIISRGPESLAHDFLDIYERDLCKQAQHGTA